jgi:diguanylate cyclase (GGDEF)-like protein
MRIIATGLTAAVPCIVLCLSGPLTSAERNRHVLIAITSVAMFAVLKLWHELRWAAPATVLEKTMRHICDGDAPMESLTEIIGPLAGIACQAQRICHDFRSCEAGIAQLNAEMSQRVAGRTDALERVIGSLRQQATRDPLTGLCNRRLLNQRLPELVIQCRAEETDLAVLMIDVDHFKHLNDTLGHAAGDQLLRDIGQIIRSTLRDGDLAYRYGGDEFVITMPAADAALVEATSARLKSLVEGLTRPLKLLPKPALSIGIARRSVLGDVSAEQLMLHADSQLYHVKTAGRRAKRSVAALRN